jgi:hypothetical protein
MPSKITPALNRNIFRLFGDDFAQRIQKLKISREFGLLKGFFDFIFHFSNHLCTLTFAA